MSEILVLQGGTSNEREVSLRSAANVTRYLRRQGHAVTVGDPAEADFDLVKLAESVDVVFPILHGAGGEDGVLQEKLEKLGKPFLGSGSAACRLTFDKAAYRAFMAQNGIRMATGAVVGRQEFESSELRKTPYVLKPIDGGSSVDVVILHDLADEPDRAYFDELFLCYPKMLLEKLIEGDELTVGILGNQSLPVILIIPPSDETFDYANKYNGKSQEIVNPAQISDEIQQKAKDLALRIHQITGCRHLSRTDMIASPSGELYVLETNTIPGMTEQSLFPKAAAAAGLDMPALVASFIDMANKL